MSAPVLFRMEPHGRVQRYGIPGFEHLIVQAQYADEGTKRSHLKDWLVIDTRFDQAFDKWVRWFVWHSPDLAGIRNWVKAGGPHLWNPDLRKADKGWWPAPGRMRPGESDANSRPPTGRRGVKALANYCAGMMIFAAADAGFGGVPEYLINELGLTTDEVQQVDDEVDAIRRRLLSRGYKGSGSESTRGGTRGEVPRRTDPGVGDEQRMGRVGRGEVRSGRRGSHRGGDLHPGRSPHQPGRQSAITAPWMAGAETKKYAVCPGRVRSENDGEWRHVGFEALVRLYGVDPADCLLVPEEAEGGKLPEVVENLIWLRPERDGRLYNEMREQLARGEDAFKLG